MKTKICTSIEQSKRLIELGLDVSTADMHYSTWTILNEGEYILSPNQGESIEELQEDYGNQIIPCWSLVALLGVLPDYTLQTNTDGTVFVVCEKAKPVISDSYDNPIDACYDMILGLHELKLL